MRTFIKMMIPAVALAVGLTACSESPMSEDVSNDKVARIANQSTDSIPPADPAIAFCIGSGAPGSDLWVMNSDGSHRTRLAGLWLDVTDPSWSPSNSIVFYSPEYGLIITGEVTIDDNGIPTWSNENYPVSNNSGLGWKETNWCSVETTGLIAFIEYPPSYLTTSEHSVKTVPVSGGEIETLYTSPFDLAITDISWSPDDEKIAVLLTANEGSGYSHSIVIVNTSTHEVTDSIPLSASAQFLEWSRASGSINKLAFVMNDRVYYVSPVTGSIPETDNADVGQIHGAGIAWSPDNGVILTTRVSPHTPSQNPHFDADNLNTELGTYDYSGKKWKVMLDPFIYFNLNWHR